MKRRLCPKCHAEMQTTYDPYECRCPDCGFWFDAYTGKQITFTDEQPEVIHYASVNWVMKGHRLGEVVDICYVPKMEGVVVGYCVEQNRWLVEHTIPKDGYSIFTEAYFDYINNH